MSSEPDDPGVRLGLPESTPIRGLLRSRTFRVGATLVVTALAVAYIVAKIDIGKCVDILRDAEPRLARAVGLPDA